MVRTCSTSDAVARDECRSLVASMAPKVVVAIERAGMTADGTYRNSLAQDFSDGRSRLDYIIAEASERGIPTIGIGDGGNEIGMGNVPDAVARFIPLGDKICPVQKTDLLLPCGVSNWGAYAIAAAIALLGFVALVPWRRQASLPDTRQWPMFCAFLQSGSQTASICQSG